MAESTKGIQAILELVLQYITPILDTAQVRKQVLLSNAVRGSISRDGRTSFETRRLLTCNGHSPIDYLL